MTSCPQLVSVPGRAVGGPVVLAIMDGIGLGRGDAADAVARANTPNLDRYRQTGLCTELSAHGRAVGMPNDDDMGNSEVGHNAMGAGRIFDQGAKLVAAAISSGEIFRSDTWQHLIGRVLHAQGTLHLLGLLSDGNVHSHIDHLLALIERADSEGIERVMVHALLDGRDVPKTSALIYVEQLEAALDVINQKPQRNYRIASGGGRMHITMDRYEADWAMVERGWHIHVRGEGRAFASVREAVATLRQEQPHVTDQDLPGFVIHQDGRPVGAVHDGDAMIAFNFRGDRMLEWVRAFEDDVFDKFPRGTRPQVMFAGMTLYDGDTHRPKRYLVSPPQIRCTLGELLCDAGVTQLACSETQKFGHVTYFWNGNKSGAFDDKLERYIEIPSLTLPFELQPRMRAQEITDAVCKEIVANKFRFTRLNYANGDMVAHTGNFDATVAAVEAVDEALGQLERVVIQSGGCLIVTADHGNAEDMGERDKKSGRPLLDAAGRIVPKTSHSLNPVPFYALLSPGDRQRFCLSESTQRGLGNIAATVAQLLGFHTPEGFYAPLIQAIPH